ncbi:PAS domain-containing protein [Rossellomorea aquimaris]|uniref:ATP-binding protein n=1 Tax=Rossellomorea aquimaris TaxID=189382 RepID=UPI001CD6C015|nr:ATP-binding protein [Rossellomorea aquimaris]MCA1055024.1 PAS domain-containing protein [Rossellomorea aquimaris]
MNEKKLQSTFQQYNIPVALICMLFLLQVLVVLFLPRPWSIAFSILIMIVGVVFLVRVKRSTKTLFSEYHHVMGEESQLSTLLHALPDFICFKDGEGRWQKVNQFGRELYNLEHIDYLGKTDRELGELVPFFKDAFDYCIESDEETWKAGGMTRCEEGFYIPSGEFKTFDVIKVPLFDEEQNRQGLVIIGRDITQQKLAEEMLLRKEKLSVVGELAAGIAHEIRNPLTSIKGFIQLLEENEHVAQNYLTVMSSEMDRINQIVGELLILSKPQMREFEPFDMRDVLDYIIKVMGHEALMNGINIHREQPETAMHVHGDRNQIIQVLINIVKNAIDAMTEGDIMIESTVSDTHITISVVDQGEGIPPDRLKRLGEPFFTLKEKGMGLGLTISQKIVEDHKGRLHIESEVGKGTRVDVRLPRWREVE